MATGKWRYVHCAYAGDHLGDGETVAVELLDFHSTLLRMTILDGGYSGWSLTEGDGTIGSTFEVGLGLFVVLVAATKWRRDPGGTGGRVESAAVCGGGAGVRACGVAGVAEGCRADRESVARGGFQNCQGLRVVTPVGAK